jgi:hypothetical protein
MKKQDDNEVFSNIEYTSAARSLTLDYLDEANVLHIIEVNAFPSPFEPKPSRGKFGILLANAIRFHFGSAYASTRKLCPKLGICIDDVRKCTALTSCILHMLRHCPLEMISQINCVCVKFVMSLEVEKQYVAFLYARVLLEVLSDREGHCYRDFCGLLKRLVFQASSCR